MAIPITPEPISTHCCPARSGDLALIECSDARTGQPRTVLCAVGRDGPEFLFTPFGHLADENPFEAYRPSEVPKRAGGE